MSTGTHKSQEFTTVPPACTYSSSTNCCCSSMSKNVSILCEVRAPIRTERSGASKSIVVEASSTDTQTKTTWTPLCW